MLNNQITLPILQKLVKQSFGLEVVIKDPKIKMGYLPSVWMSAKDFTVLDKNKISPLTIKEPKIKIQLLPLLFKNIHIDYFSCEKISADIKFDKKMRLYIGNHLILNKPDKRITLEGAKVGIQSYKFNIKDEYFNKDIYIDGEYFDLLEYNSKKQIKFSLNTRLKINDNFSIINTDIDFKLPFKKNFTQNTVIFDGTATNINLADLSPYIKRFSDGEIQSMKGIINFQAKSNEIGKRVNKTRITFQFVIKDFFLLTKSLKAPIYEQGKLKLYTIADVSRNTIDIKKFNLLSKNINLDIAGKITKIRSKNPHYDMKLRLFDTRSEDLIKLLPGAEFKDSAINFIALKKYGFYSDVEGNLKIQGRQNRINLSGLLVAKNAYTIKPLAPDVPKIDLKLKFRGKSVFMDLVVPTSKSQNVSIKGDIDIHTRHSNLDVTSTDNVDLNIAQSILVPAHEIFFFELGPLPVMKLFGEGNIKLKIEGDNTNPHLFGAFNYNNASLAFEGIDMWIKKAEGSLSFKDKDTYFVTKSAYLNNKPVKVDGKCNLIGELDYKAETSEQNLNDLIKILNNSQLLKKFEKYPIPKSAAGLANIDLHLTGTAKDINKIVIGENIFVECKLILKNGSIIFNDIKSALKNINGEIHLINNDTKVDLKAGFEKSKLTLKGNIQDNHSNIEINSTQFNIGEFINILPRETSKSLRYLPSLTKFFVSFKAQYNGEMDNFQPEKVTLNGKVLPIPVKSTNLILNAGDFHMKNSLIHINKINGAYKNNAFNGFVVIKDAFKKSQSIDGAFESTNFDLSLLKNISKIPYIAENERKILSKFSDYKGNVDLKILIKHNSIHTKIDLKDLTVSYTPLDLPIKVVSGSCELKGDKIYLFKVNSLIGSMPILIDGYIQNIFDKPFFNIYVNAKPNQRFLDKYINSNQTYPIKIRGDILYSARYKGTKDYYSTKSEINFEKDSSLYYMGLALGDANNPIRIFLDTTNTAKFINIVNFQYDKLISSLNNKEFVSPQLNAKGLLQLNHSKMIFSNFRVKTQNPTDAKIFNIVFKRPVIKQGQFTSNIDINGEAPVIKIKGAIDFTGIDMPLWDTTIKDISLDFNDADINVKAKGDVLSNKLNFNAIIKNNFAAPYVIKDANIYFENLDINGIINTLNRLDLIGAKAKASNKLPELNVSDFVVKNADLKADYVSIKNVRAVNLLAKFALDENLILSCDNFKFFMADGAIKGGFKHNFLNSNSKLNLSIEKANANEITDILFNLPNQIFGSLTGDISLTCNSRTNTTCSQTLSGHGGFEVKNGKMPKLGSLEYLLKASNLVKSGVTGLTINSLVDLVAPLKTGHFDSIRGDIDIDSGIANSIQIFSKGKDLSLFITGSYNFSTITADMTVFGRLSKKVTSILGPIGNASLNTLFNTIPGLNLDETNKDQLFEGINKIPGIELSDKLYRIFSAKIYGDINGENYVQSFKWIE